MYGAALLYRRFRGPRQVWRFGLAPDEVAGFIGAYGWKLMNRPARITTGAITLTRPAAT